MVLESEQEEIDRPDDLILVLLHRCEMYRGLLNKKIDNLDTEPFPFDSMYSDYGEFMDSLRMFEANDIFDNFEKGEPIILSCKGEKVAGKLDDQLSSEQEEAVEKVFSNGV
jgi:hypothetical protein